MSLRDNTERHLFYKDIYKHRGYAYESGIMHVLLLDKDGRVILVGNPLSNKKVEELLYSKLRYS